MGPSRHLVVATAAVVLFSALGACTAPPGLDPAQLAACRSERDTIEVALEATFIDNGSYPPSLEAMEGGYLKPGSLDFAWVYLGGGDTYSLEGLC